MATYINRRFDGSWFNYQNKRPIIHFEYSGYKNTGANFGCKAGCTGDADYTADDTYASMGCDGIHAKCVLAAWFNGDLWILTPIGFPRGWNTFTLKKNMLQNDITGVFGKNVVFNTISEPNTPQLIFQQQFDEYPMFDFNNKQIGVQEFGALIRANCPIIRTDSNRHLVKLKDGRQVPLSASVLLSDILESEFLNQKYDTLGGEKFFIRTKCEKYNISGTGAKTGTISMVAETNWKEDATEAYPSPYLVLSQYDGVDCLKLFLTPSQNVISEATANYGNGDTSVDLQAGIYGDIDTPASSLIKKLGFYYKNGTSKKSVSGVVNVYQTVSFSTNIPIFETEQEGFNWAYENSQGNKGVADELLNGALNKDDLSDTYNPIGDPINSMDLDIGYTQQAMSTQYAMPKDTLSELANNLFNTDVAISDAINEGLKMYGANPVNCIIDLQYYPFNVGEYIQNSPETYIYFGSYKMDFTNSFIKLYNTKCLIDCGSLIYPEQTNSYLDYEPYSELYIYLPYVGTQKLDIASYLNKVVNLKYIVDVQTGACDAVLFANDIIIDSFSGKIGAKQCISSIDYANYSQKIMDNVFGRTKSAVSGLGGVAMGDPKSVIGGAFGFLESIYSGQQMQNSQHISIRDSTTPTSSYAMPQYAYFYTVKNEISVPENEQEIIGYPSNTGGKVSQFKGFLQCSKVNIETTATNAEKEKLYELLKNGIYL